MQETGQQEWEYTGIANYKSRTEQLLEISYCCQRAGESARVCQNRHYNEKEMQVVSFSQKLNFGF